MQRTRQQVILKARPLKRIKTEAGSQPAHSQPVAMDVIAPRRKRRLSAAQLGVELKFLDNSLVAQALTAPTDWTGCEADPATTLCLTAPAQGDGANNRDGKQIIGKSLHVSGKIACLVQELQGNPPEATEVYVAVVLDKQTNNAQLNSEDVMTNVAANAALNAFPLRNMSFGKRFKVLRGERLVMQNDAISHFAVDSFAHSGLSQSFDWFIPLKDLRINFNQTSTGVIGNVLDNSIHVIAICNQTLTAPSISYNSRFRFVG